MLKFNYYGHACFQIDDGKYKILFDPFLTGNPAATIKAEEVQADYIFYLPQLIVLLLFEIDIFLLALKKL